jgi:hypothetical protein
MRLALPLLAAFLLAGCTTTRIVDATDPTALAGVQSRVAGREADITLVSGDLYRGRVAFLRPDSTAWEEAAGVFAVATDEVRLIVTDNRRRTLTRGALIGAGIGFGTCFAAGVAISNELDYSGNGSDTLQTGLALGALCVPGGLFYGLIGGAVAGRRAEYIFVDVLPEADDTPLPQPGDGDAP